MEKLIDLFEEFQSKWTLERVENMRLEDYTGVAGVGENRGDFTFWIENKLGGLGSIWGANSFKFGIYRRGDNSEKESEDYIFDSDYAWAKKYGDNKKQAFEKIKS